jgi:hypothetical protein
LWSAPAVLLSEGSAAIRDEERLTGIIYNNRKILNEEPYTTF